MQQRKIHMDLLRILAILCVIYNHTNERGYYLYAFPSSRPVHDFYIVAASLIAVAVPIFFMISGALLLPKEESFGILFKKRICRMLLVLLIFSGMQFAIQAAEGRRELSLTVFLAALFSEAVIPPYWFLYAYLAYLLILPFLRKIVTVMTKRDYLYLFGLLLIVEGVLPAMLYPMGISGLNDFFVVPFLNRVVVYPLLGYYMENYVSWERCNKKTTALVVSAMALVLAFFVVMTNLRALPYISFTAYDKGLYTGSFTMILDAGVYYLVRRVCDKREWKNGLLEKSIASMGKCVFGIYLVEQPIREHTVMICDILKVHIGSFPACVVWVCCAFLISYGVVLILRQIPGIKSLL